MRTLDISSSSSCKRYSFISFLRVKYNLYFYTNGHFKCGISSATVESVAWVKQHLDWHSEVFGALCGFSHMIKMGQKPHVVVIFRIQLWFWVHLHGPASPL